MLALREASAIFGTSLLCFSQGSALQPRSEPINGAAMWRDYVAARVLWFRCSVQRPVRENQSPNWSFSETAICSASRQGTAFPICFAILIFEPHHTKSSGKV